MPTSSSSTSSGSADGATDTLSSEKVVADDTDGEGDGKRDVRKENEDEVEGATDAIRPRTRSVWDYEVCDAYSPKPSLRIEETLPLLPLVLAALGLLVSRSRFLAPSSFSSSFLGGTFSFPRPNLKPPSKSGSSSPFPRPNPPEPADSSDLSDEGDDVDNDGVLWVRVRVPPLPEDEEGEGDGSPEPKPKPLAFPFADRRVDGVKSELDRVSALRIEGRS
jgi:hypothetical protein